MRDCLKDRGLSGQSPKEKMLPLHLEGCQGGRGVCVCVCVCVCGLCGVGGCVCVCVCVCVCWERGGDRGRHCRK